MRTPTILLLLIVLATAANAATVVLLTPQFYEGTTPWVVLDIDNRGFVPVSAVSMNSTLPVIQAANYTGWATLISTPYVSWSNGTIEGNVRSALFEYQTRMPLVNQNGVIQVEARLDGVPTFLNLTVLNDNTPPTITLLSPVGFVGPVATNVSINASDSETGVANVSYKFGPCSGTQQILPLTLSNGIYTGTANMSGLVEGDSLCYTVNATNNAGGVTTQNGQLIVDATAPTVLAIAPTNYTTEATTFTVRASDNLAPSLDCRITIDATQVASLSVANNTQNSTTVSLLNATTEGAHIWKATCFDAVGLSATALQNLVLDTQPPSVTLNVPATLARTQSANAVATITDTLGLTSVNATFDGTTLALAQSGNTYSASIISATLGAHTVVFTAKDNAGHITTKTATVTVVPNHAIALSLNPTSTSKNNVVTASGAVTPDGNLSATTITLLTPSGNQSVPLSGNSYTTTFLAPNDGTYTITALFNENNHTYSAAATLTVGNTASGVSPNLGGGYRPSTNRVNTGGGSPESPEAAPAPAPTEPAASSPPAEEKTASQPAEPAAYQPLESSEPRHALVPQATGVFTLHPSVKWLALFVALFGLAGLGAYAYNKRQPPEKEDGSVSWDNYFER